MVLVQKELKAAYIGEVTWWKPWANTLFYYNLNQSNSVFTDTMWHTTNTSWIVYNASGVSDWCGYNSANFNRIQGLFNSWETFPSNFTIMGFMKPTGNSWSGDHPMWIVLTNGSTYTVWGIWFNQSNSQVQFNHLRENVAWDTSTYTFSALNSWHHYAMTFNGTNMVGYIDGTQVITRAVSGSWSGSPYASTWGFTIFGRYVTGGENTSWLANVIQGYVDEVICEDKVRTAQDIQDYLTNFTY